MELEEMIKIKQERGYSIRQIAEYSGVPEGTVRKIFSDQTMVPRVATMIALEKVFSGDESLYQGKKYTYDMNSIAPEYQKYLDEAGSTGSHISETVFAYGKKGLMTVADFDALPETCQCELIDGILYDMGEPSFTHQDIVAEFITQTRTYIRAKKLKCKVVGNPGVQIFNDDHNLLVPDLAIVCRDKTPIEHYVKGAPEFCLEVVSKWGVQRDYVVKLGKYAQAEVGEYWIIDPFKTMITIYSEAEKYAPEIIPIQGKRSLNVFGGEFELDLDEIAAIIDDSDDVL